MDKKTHVPNPSPTDIVMEEAQILKTQSRKSDSDILGSYTGTAADGDIPEQDVDDL